MQRILLEEYLEFKIKILLSKKNMNKKILFLILLAGLLILPVVSYADGDTIGGILGTISKSLGGLGGALATIGFVVAGIIYISATTNPSHVQLAKGALIAAVIGIVIILLAGSACVFIQTFTGAGGSCTTGT